jgi:hypothetical protein
MVMVVYRHRQGHRQGYRHDRQVINNSTIPHLKINMILVRLFLIGHAITTKSIFKTWMTSFQEENINVFT